MTNPQNTSSLSFQNEAGYPTPGTLYTLHPPRRWSRGTRCGQNLGHPFNQY